MKVNECCLRTRRLVIAQCAHKLREQAGIMRSNAAGHPHLASQEQDARALMLAASMLEAPDYRD